MTSAPEAPGGPAAPRKRGYTTEAWAVTISAVLSALLTCVLYWLVGS